MMDILANTNKQACSGCGACSNVCPCNAIRFKPDELGFDYPYIDESKCIKCGRCVSACEYVQGKQLRTPIKAFAATNRGKKVLMKSSSGGVFSVLAEYVLDNGGAVCGCIYDQDLMPIHICTEKKEEFLQMRKSKYVQSDVGVIYQHIKQRLKNGQLVLFTGTPCQVGALYSVVGEKNDNLITVDLICHGVPSRLMFSKFLEYLENKYKTKIIDFDFRSKKYGWQRFTMEFKDINGRIKNIGKANEFYLPAFTGGNIIRPNCFSCKFACPERVGDITVGDFWGHEKIDLSCDTTNGVSLCILNTEAAIKLIDVLAKQLFMEEIDYQVAVIGNTCLHKPTSKGKKWEQYMQALKADEIPIIAQKYIKNNRKAILKGKIKLLVPVSVFKFVKKQQYRNK